jgi:hypothetical protein
MPKLNNDGVFAVRITDAFVKEPGYNYHGKPENLKNDPNAFALVLKVETPDGLFAFHQMEWTKKQIPSGKYMGKTDAEATTEKLADLSVPDGYPGNLKKMLEEGKTIEASVKMEWRDWTDSEGKPQRILEAKYLNPPRKEINIKDFDFDAVLGKQTTVTSTPKSVEKELDDTFEPDSFETESSPI